MKNRLYYVLFLLYAIVVAFILYVNGVFTGGDVSLVNLFINVGFLVIIGVLFVISAVSFGRLNNVTDELVMLLSAFRKNIKSRAEKMFGGIIRTGAMSLKTRN